MKIKCYYRLCDKARMGYGYNWKNCFENFIRNFQPKSEELIVYIDNSEEQTNQEAIEICKKYQFSHRLTKLGNAMSFYVTAEDALANPDDTIIYFVENDYLHRRGSKEALIEIFSTFAKDDYATLYDHPDKYYPYLWDTNTESYSNYCELPENTNILSKLFCLKSGWWRTVPTTCMTFACLAKTLKMDFEIFKKWTQPYGADRPKDFDMFNELIKNGRKLYSPIPSYSGHTSLLPTGVNWRNT